MQFGTLSQAYHLPMPSMEGAARSEGCGGSHAVAQPSLELDVTHGTGAVRIGRRFVAERIATLGASSMASDAALITGELVANALQHGHPPVSVSVSGDASCVRIAVADGNPRPPVRPAASLANMTGRGIALIESVAARWGVDRDPSGGKVVWAELEPVGSADAVDEVDVDGLLAAWQDDEAEVADARFTVVLGDVPTELLIAAKAHMDNLVREFTLAATASDAVPQHLARLIETVVHDFADARDAIKRQALAALHRNEQRTSLTLYLPLTAADAGERYLAALDEADAYSRAARLLTLETPAAHRLFRRWYVEAVIRQLRDVAAGRVPAPVVPFEERLIAEVERLAALQRVTDRAARSQQVMAALARARTPEDVAAVVVSEGVDALGATGGGMLLPAPDGEHVVVPGAVGYGEELVDALREERLDAPLPAATALRTGEAVWLESQDERDRVFPALRGFEGATVAMCALPLTVGGRTLGALRFSFSSRRLFDEDERAFVLALAAQTAQTLERTERYAAEREASLELQRALLPYDAPSIPGFDVATHYSPAGGQQAGGDFYDVIALPDGRCLAVVGDVMGRGLEAAAAMGQVRTMIRSYAIDDPDPAVVFGKVDSYFAAFDLEQLVTVLYFLADPTTGTVEVGNAGHLPPLLVDANGSREVSTTVGPPFGVDATGRTSCSITLAPGDALVAITDGLVERRDADIDIGIQLVLEAARRARPASAATLLQRVIEGAGDHRDHDDDVTALVLHRIPSGG
jgi:serine phosphatase RsbU (regulator of sigma subunit)/anti-sigma regulatory factor (Ser/Thr protein kinase)